jgi:hypothetical protein
VINFRVQLWELPHHDSTKIWLIFNLIDDGIEGSWADVT